MALLLDRNVSSAFKALFCSICLLLLESCGGPCMSVEDMNTETHTFEVKGKPDKLVAGDKRTYWTDTGIFLEFPEEEMQAQASGSVNLCAQTDTHKAKADVMLRWDFDNTGADTGIDVRVGDMVQFQVQYRKIHISDCNSPPAGVYVHDVDKCKYGFTASGIEYPSYLNRDLTALNGVDSFPQTPMDNVLKNASYPWINGGRIMIIPEKYIYQVEVPGQSTATDVLDDFPPLSEDEKNALVAYQGEQGISDEEVMKRYRCTGGFTYNGVSFKLDPTKVTAYALNQYCENIIEFGRDVTCDAWDSGSRDLPPVVNEIVSKSIGQMNETCYVPTTIPGEGGSPPVTFNMTQARNAYLQRLTGRVKNGSSVVQELPDGGAHPEAPDYAKHHSRDPDYPSINIGYPYQISAEGRLWVVVKHVVSNNYTSAFLDLGGYSVHVEKQCPATNNLYLYIGEDVDSSGNPAPPNLSPGENGTYKVPLDQDSLFYINKGANSASEGPPAFHPQTKGRLYFGVADNGDGWENNEGSYSVSVKVPIQNKRSFSKLVEYIEEPIMYILFGERKEDGTMSGGVVNMFYSRIITSQDFHRFVALVCTLMIAAYSGFVLMGLTQASVRDVVLICIKIGIFFQLMQPNSWEFFNSHLFIFFTDGIKELIAIVTTPPGSEVPSTVDDAFKEFDKTVGRFLDINTWLQIFSYLLAGPMGWLYFQLYVWGAISFITAVFGAYLLYLMAVVMGGLLISLAPLFILSLAFKFTGKIFQSWLKSMASCGGQPVFVFAAIGMLNTIIEPILDSIFGFGMCSRCAIYAELGGNVMKLCLANAPMPEGMDNGVNIEQRMSVTSSESYNLGLPKSVAMLFLYVTLTVMMKNACSVIAKIAVSILGVFNIELAHRASAITDNVKSVFGMDEQSKRQRAMARADAAARGQSGGASLRTRRDKGVGEGGRGGTGGAKGGATTGGPGAKGTPTPPRGGAEDVIRPSGSSTGASTGTVPSSGSQSSDVIRPSTSSTGSDGASADFGAGAGLGAMPTSPLSIQGHATGETSATPSTTESSAGSSDLQATVPQEFGGAAIAGEGVSGAGEGGFRAPIVSPDDLFSAPINVVGGEAGPSPGPGDSGADRFSIEAASRAISGEEASQLNVEHLQQRGDVRADVAADTPSTPPPSYESYIRDTGPSGPPSTTQSSGPVDNIATRRDEGESDA